MLYIFTPTYNREMLLEQLYKSLLKQTNSNFKWLIIDDGSSDFTKKTVQSWVKNSPFKIEYIYKENGGKYTAFNLALDKIQDYLNVCIDSDDTVSPDFVEIILKNHRKYEKKEDIISYVYPWTNGTFQFEIDIKTTPKIVNSWKVSNDIPGVKEVIRVFKPFILKGIRFEIFIDEKFQPETVLFSQAAKKGNSLYFSNPLVIGDYQEDGLTNQLSKNILNNPKGFILAQMLQFEFLSLYPQKNNFKNRVKTLAQIIALNVGLRRNVFKELPRTKLILISLPIGVLYGLKKYKKID